MICTLLPILTLLSACSEAPKPFPQPTRFSVSLDQPGAVVDAQMAVAIVSAYRQNHGLGALVLDPDLQKAAEKHVQAMAARDRTVSAEAVKAYLARDGVISDPLGVNVSAGYRGLAEAFSGWRDSPPHNATMLLAGAARMGIATAYSPQSKYKVYWTLIVTGP